jgi:hypothetical protein
VNNRLKKFMKLVKLSIVALSLGTIVASCCGRSGSETPNHNSIAAPTQTPPTANDSRPIPLTEAAAKEMAAADLEKAAHDADSVAQAAHAVADSAENDAAAARRRQNGASN